MSAKSATRDGVARRSVSMKRSFATETPSNTRESVRASLTRRTMPVKSPANASAVQAIVTEPDLSVGMKTHPKIHASAVK